MNPLALLAAAPAVPYEKAGRFVAAAFIVLFACVLIYVAIMATKLQRLERDLSELNRALDEQERAKAAASAADEPPVGAEAS
ncbi:hypothetical protein [Conexibacter arvalis]|uniref:Cell division protein FtsL n=1 Tax=Conexibacter arvalis TaxID=912552 RepID=A0A840IAH9_9ACTN|nr:cell division protein FtsL [Conexibacter arvalis]